MDITDQIKIVLGDKRNYINLQNPNIGTYKAWYNGFVEGFHKFEVYNGTSYITRHKKTLAMAKQLCEDWASLLLNEKTDIVLPGTAGKAFNKILKDSRFWIKANEGVEISYALGIGAIVDSIEGVAVDEAGTIVKKGRFTCDFIDAECIYPITVANGLITECAFVKENSNTLIIQTHLLEDGNYNIYENLFNKNALGAWEAAEEIKVLNTGSPVAWFHFIKPQIANNKELGSAAGISIFANAIDTLMAIDTKYDSFDLEFELGRKRVYVSAEATKVVEADNGTSQLVPTFDPSDVVHFKLPESDDGKPYVQVDSTPLRVEDHIRALNQELNILSSKCGLGENYYKFDGAGGRPVQTATASILQQGNLFRKIKKAEIGIENFLLSFTRAVIYISNNFTDEPIGDIDFNKIVITFDDNIIDDKDKQRETDRKDVDAGLMTIEEYRAKWYGESQDEAIKFVHKNLVGTLINKYLPALQGGAITPEDYVVLVYGGSIEDEENQKRIAYVYENLSANDGLDMSLGTDDKDI